MMSANLLYEHNKHINLVVKMICCELREMYLNVAS